MSDIRVRFAPSPTGHLHIGGVRTAMFNWLFARSTGGTYLIRVEDTDTQRSTKEYLESQLASLKWLDLLPDEPIVYQMERADKHQEVAATLLESGYAYPCFCKPRDAQEVVESLEQGHGSKYDRTCREKTFTAQDLEKPHAIRFKLPDGQENIEFDDVIRGKISVALDQLDDFIIVRQDKTPIYNFCVVLDDLFMKVSHVIRGEDHISNTLKQLMLYKALGQTPPQFAHLPLILGQAGNKLSKRDASVSVEEYRQNGFLPDALFNYLVRLGWSHGDQEIFTRDEMVKHFALKNVGKKGAIFDMKKLTWLNGVYLRECSAEKVLEHVGVMDSQLREALERAWPAETLARLLDVYKSRAETLHDFQSVVALATQQELYDLSLIDKWRSEKTPQLLEAFVRVMTTQGFEIAHKSLLAAAKEVCAQHEEKLVALAQPLRLAITGKTQSPGVFELIEILGKEDGVKRINTLINQLKH